MNAPLSDRNTPPNDGTAVSIDLDPMEALALLVGIASLDGPSISVAEGPSHDAARARTRTARRRSRRRRDRPTDSAPAGDAGAPVSRNAQETRQRGGTVNLSTLIRLRARRIDWSDPRARVRGESRIVRAIERRFADDVVGDVDAKDRRDGTTALHRAIALRLWRVASALVSHGADGSVDDAQGVTALALATAVSSDDPCALALVRDMAAAAEAPSPPRSPSSHRTAAGVADGDGGNADATLTARETDETTADRGASPRPPWPSIEALSQVASNVVDAPAVMALLLDGVGGDGRARGPATAGAGVRAADVLGPWGDARWTLLHKAARHGNAGVALVLLGRGADPNATTVDGVTPLHIAALCGYMQTAMVLLAHGADPALPTGDIVTEGNDPAWSRTTAGALARMCGHPMLGDAIDAWTARDPPVILSLFDARGGTRDATDSDAEAGPHEDASPDSP